MEVTTQVRSQLRFLEEIDRFNTKKRAEQHREMLLKAARVSELPPCLCAVCYFNSVFAAIILQ